MKLAIASPSPSSYSETFIQMQMESLPCVLRIHGRPVGSETIPGGKISLWSNPQSFLNPARLLRMGEVAMAINGREKLAEILGEVQTVAIKQRLKEHRIDRVLVNFGPMGVALLPGCRELAIPLFVHFHGYDAHQEKILEKYSRAYRDLGKAAAGIIAVSEHMVSALKAAGFPGDKIHLLRCGVDPLDFQTAEVSTGRTFFAVGRFAEKKAPYLTLAAFKGVWERFPDARLVMGGNGGLWEATQNLAKAWGLEASVSFPGVLSRKQVIEHMRGALAFVQHSLTPGSGDSKGDCEGTPVAILEAMMMGLPIVSTRHAGIGEVIEEGRTGFLVSERDTASMTRAMIQIIEDPVAARKVGNAARVVALAKHTRQQYISGLANILGGS